MNEAKENTHKKPAKKAPAQICMEWLTIYFLFRFHQPREFFEILANELGTTTRRKKTLKWVYYFMIKHNL